jgi:RNA-directed DNA polymerase
MWHWRATCGENRMRRSEGGRRKRVRTCGNLAGDLPSGGSGIEKGRIAAMPKDAPPNGGARDDAPEGSWSRVSEMQAKLHRWAAADPGRRFDDLFNFAHDPATLIVAFDRVAGNTGSRTPGVDGLTVADVEEQIGVPGFLDDLRTQLKTGSFRPLPVREHAIPKPGGSGKVRSLRIPTVADRVVQAALKLVLEPIFEADFAPVSYGFRLQRRAHDAVAEIQRFGTKGYRWVLDADIEACFDSISHVALMDRMRARVKDKRGLALVKAFCKAGVLTELGRRKDTDAGTPQGASATRSRTFMSRSRWLEVRLMPGM